MHKPKIPFFAYVDPDAFEKILSNLFNNAIKYCEDTVIVKLLPSQETNQNFTVLFMNNGYMISPDLKETIFEPFFRIKETEKQLGTGIGLQLSRSLAELHKGTLKLIEPIANFNVFSLILPTYQEHELGSDRE